jgi:hypothetical protein
MLNACSTSAATDDGRCFSTFVFASMLAVPNPAGSLTPRRAAAISVASRLAKIAPKIEVPKVPPMVRKNVAPEVAAPRSL